jgi:cytochrome c
MKTCLATLASLFVICVLASSAADPAHGDSARGKDAFEKRCSGCHGLDRTKEGPMLRKVFGRPSGATPDFPYSDGVKKAHLTWDEATLDKWLEDPEKLIPGNDMSTRVPDPTDRANIIAYLRSLNPR